MSNKSLPNITIQSGTFNSNIPLLKQMLNSVKMQNYPKSNIEHIVFDKGSTNGSDKVTKQYGCKVIYRNDSLENAQLSAAIGVQIAKGQLVLVLETDNILTSKNWLKQMVQPFIDNKYVVCTFSKYNSYKRNMNATTRYCALMGSPDPTLYYLDKTEKIRMDQRVYNKGLVLQRTKYYDIVRFSGDNLPTLGDNGHMFKKSAMLKVISNPKEYTHTDAFKKLLDIGYDTYGVVDNSIVHAMQPNIFELVRRRVIIKKIYYDGRRGRRAYLVFNPKSKKDRRHLAIYVMYSLTVVQPLMVSVAGYIRIHDPAWFLHPIFCFFMVIGYSWSELLFRVKKVCRL